MTFVAITLFSTFSVFTFFFALSSINFMSQKLFVITEDNLASLSDSGK